MRDEDEDAKYLYECVEANMRIYFQFVQGVVWLINQVGIVKGLYMKPCKQNTDKDFALPLTDLKAGIAKLRTGFQKPHIFKMGQGEDFRNLIFERYIFFIYAPTKPKPRMQSYKPC